MKKLFLSLVLLLGATILLNAQSAVTYSKNYTIAITPVTPPTVTIQVVDAGVSMIYNGTTYTSTSSPQLSLTGASGNPPVVTVQTTNANNYVHFLFTVKGQGNYNYTNYCHLFMDLSSPTPPSPSQVQWAVDPVSGDITSAFAQSSTNTVIGIGQPSSGGGNVPSLRAPLDPNIVYLVDYNASTGNMLFRGNLPFTPGMTQTVDFAGLNSIFQKRFSQLLPGQQFPASYNLVVVSLIEAQGEGLDVEAVAFGTTVQALSANQPSSPVANPGGVTQIANGQLLWASVLPLIPAPVIKIGQTLSTDMRTAGTNPKTPTIYYVHCANGHDRTFLAVSSYLFSAYPKISTDNLYMYGTTVASLDATVYSASCFAINLIDSTKTAVSGKSRIYPISADYTNTFVSVVGKPVDAQYTQNISGYSTPTGYGLQTFPWNDPGATPAPSAK